MNVLPPCGHTLPKKTYTSQDIHYNEKLMHFGVDVTGQNEIRVEVSLVTDNEWDDPIILIDGLSPVSYTHQMCIRDRVGMGAGNKVFKQANVLRAMLLETSQEEDRTMWVRCV